MGLDFSGLRIVQGVCSIVLITRLVSGGNNYRIPIVRPAGRTIPALVLHRPDANFYRVTFEYIYWLTWLKV